MPPSPPSTARVRRFGANISLRARAARGTIVNGAFLTAVNGLAMARGFVVAGFLTTVEYGVWGVLVVMIATLAVLKEVGIGEKFVQQDVADQEREFQRAVTLNVALALTVAVVGVGLIVGASELYGTPEIVAPGLCLLLSLPAVALQLPLSIFYRRMDFLRQRRLQAVDPILAFTITVVLAVTDHGYWSMVIGTLAGAYGGAIVALIACPYRLRPAFERETLNRYFGFSWPIFVSGMGFVVTGQVLTAVGEASVGLAGLGAIALTATITQFADRADKAITETIYPAICAVQDRLDLLHESFVKSNRLALMWGVPFGLGLALFSEDLLVRVLGEEWRSAVTLLQATAVAAAVHQIGFSWQAYYRARGDTRPAAVSGGIAVASCLALMVPPLIVWGLDGLAVGILAAEAVNTAVRVHYLRRIFPRLDVVRHAVSAIVPTLPGVALILGMRLFEHGDRPLTLAAGELALFLGLTAGYTYLFEGPLLREVVGYVRSRASTAAA